ncbi:MAG: replication initiator protein [Microviridae sp.]|nr:MAG: replication initiator protein [Microviridae sp.]
MCTREITAYHNPCGGRPIFGWEGIKNGLQELKLPCGKCPECCKDYYTMWATRGSRELARWDTSLFITLTYNEENLPDDNSLDKKHVQDFIKRVKKEFHSSKANPIRQTYCGEYGSTTGRPHYHVILYNCDFTDRKPHYTSNAGHQVFTSKKLTDLWGKGNAEFGFATPASIAYLYKYILKKKSRKEKLAGPLLIETPDGVTHEVAHEFIESSRNPGIGAHLRESESIKKGFLSVNGVRTKLPKYYLNWLKENEPNVFAKIQDKKFDFMSNRPKETSLRKKQKEDAQKKLTDTRKKL